MSDTHLAEIAEKINNMVDMLLLGQSVDCVILGYQKKQLYVLLARWKGTSIWCLPGGFILKSEDIEDAARRVLRERIGLQDNIFLRQFYTFGPGQRRRDLHPISYMGNLQELISQDARDFLAARFITTGYYALIDINHSKPQADLFSDECTWCSLNDLPNLMLDHEEILNRALRQIRIELNYLPFGEALLPEKFTLGELRGLYESILGRPLDRGNFQRKMLRLGHLVRHDKKQSGAAHRAPYLYSFDKQSYEQLRDKGIGYL
ncbi:MAG: NUDIX domain-containing protein [Bacteroidota bacterium]